MEKILAKESLPSWINALRGYVVYAPVKDNAEENDDCNFQVVKSGEGIDFKFSNTVQPPKKLMFPQREVFFRFNQSDRSGIDVRETLPEIPQTVIFGVRPCDAKAVALLDRIFLEEYDDPYYCARRQNIILVGLGCTSPCADCFCTAVGGSPHGVAGMDILLTDLGEDFHLEVRTEAGKALIGKAEKQFREPHTEEQNKCRTIRSRAVEQISRKLENEKRVVSRLDGLFTSPLWDEEAMSCIRCGICTYLCPSCHCFDIDDEVDVLSPLSGKRVRTWDNCQFPYFTMHSSGHNPRPDKASRLRRRVLHKFLYFVQTHEEYLCTGCGRCISHCPVGIDIVEIVNKATGKKEDPPKRRRKTDHQ